MEYVTWSFAFADCFAERGHFQDAVHQWRRSGDNKAECQAERCGHVYDFGKEHGCRRCHESDYHRPIMEYVTWSFAFADCCSMELAPVPTACCFRSATAGFVPTFLSHCVPAITVSGAREVIVTDMAYMDGKFSVIGNTNGTGSYDGRSGAGTFNWSPSKYTKIEFSYYSDHVSCIERQRLRLAPTQTERRPRNRRTGNAAAIARAAGHIRQAGGNRV